MNEEAHIVVGVSGRHDGAFVVADVDDSATLDPAQLSGRVPALSETEHVILGNATCTGEWPGVVPGSSGRGSLDIAGNFSGWSDELLVEIPVVDFSEPAPDEPGCASVPAAPFALVVVLAARRRKRHP